MNILKFTLFFFLLILNTSLIAQQATIPVTSSLTVDGIPSDSVQVKRLVKLCELWGKIKYFHPYLGYKPIDWDSALVQTIPKVKAAQSSAEYTKAIDEMLTTLDDPATYVIRENQNNKPLALPGEAHPTSYEKDGVLVVEMTDYSDLSNVGETERKLAAIKDKLSNKRAIIFDLRKLTKEGFTWAQLSLSFGSSGLTNLLLPSEIKLPGQRYLVHYGPPSSAYTGSTYQTGYLNQIDPPTDNHTSTGIDLPLVFLVNERTQIPDFVLALQHAGRAIVIGEGKVTDKILVSTSRIDIGESHAVNIRSGELIFSDGALGFSPNVTVGPFEKNDEALQWAINYTQAVISGKETVLAPVKRSVSILPDQKADKIYGEPKFPSEEYRLLAVFRIWNVIEYFFPFKDLMDKNWHGVLPEFIRKFQTASSVKDYDLALAEMVACLQDSHAAGIGVNVLTSLYGNSFPAVSLKMVKNSPVVFKVAHDSIVKKYGIRIGDEILQVDGEKVTERINKFAHYISASTEDINLSIAASISLGGAAQSEAHLAVRNSDGAIRNVKLPRNSTVASFRTLRARTNEIIKELDGHIGYIDMDRLQENQLEDVKQLLGRVKSVILDMRGYPSSGAPYQVATWLSNNKGARSETPVALSKGDGGFSVMYHHQYPDVEYDGKVRFKMPVAVLIYEYTQSAAESFVLKMDQSPNVTIIGSNSSGADGAVSSFYVPGGRRVNFTGQVWTYQDGRRLQRLGVVPDIYIKPTLEGIRKGKDEVLEKAVEFLKNSRAK